MGTVAQTLSFQGLASGVQTDALVSAILAQDGQGVATLQAKQTANTNQSNALTSMQTAMTTLYTSLAVMQDQLNSQTVTSTDANNSYVTATSSGAVAGNYTVSVSKVATTGRISSTLDANGNPSNLAVNSLTQQIFSGASDTFAVQGTDGVVKPLTVTDNSLTGLRDAINNSGAGVTATIVNNGGAVNPYQLVITADSTGTGATQGVVTIADTGGGNSLGIAAGSVATDGSGNQSITGGLTSTASGVTAQNAVFTVNGIQLTRQTNVVSDAVDGVTFNLLQGGQTGTTTLTVAQNQAAATTALQTVITNYNTIVTGYTSASTATKNSDGSINPGALSGDATSASLMVQIRSAMLGVSSGLSAAGAPYTSLASVGVSINSDGTLTLNTTAFQNALTKNPTAVVNLFTTSGGSSSGTTAIKGPGQTVSDLLFNLTTSGNSMLVTALKSIANNNTALAQQIANGQAQLATQKTVLEKQFSDMEVTVAQMKAAATGLIGS